MLTRLIVLIISQYVQIWNRYLYTQDKYNVTCQLYLNLKNKLAND